MHPHPKLGACTLILCMVIEKLSTCTTSNCREINEFDFLLIFLGSKIHVARSSNIFFLHLGWASCVPSLQPLHHLVSAFLLHHLSSSYRPHYTPATGFCLNFQVRLSLWAFAVAVPSSLSCPSCCFAWLASACWLGSYFQCQLLWEACHGHSI